MSGVDLDYSFFHTSLSNFFHTSGQDWSCLPTALLFFRIFAIYGLLSNNVHFNFLCNMFKRLHLDKFKCLFHACVTKGDFKTKQCGNEGIRFTFSALHLFTQPPNNEWGWITLGDTEGIRLFCTGFEKAWKLYWANTQVWMVLYKSINNNGHHDDVARKDPNPACFYVTLLSRRITSNIICWS